MVRCTERPFSPRAFYSIRLKSFKRFYNDLQSYTMCAFVIVTLQRLQPVEQIGNQRRQDRWQYACFTI